MGSFKLCLPMGGVSGGNNLTSSKKSPTTQLFNRCQLPVKDPVKMEEELPVELRVKALFEENYLAPNPSSGKPQKSNTNLLQSNESLKKKKKSKTNLSTGSKDSKGKSPSTTSFLDYLTSNQPPLEPEFVSKRTQTDPLPEPPRQPPVASQSSASSRSGKGGQQIKFNSDEIKQHVTKECNNAAGQIAERIPPIEDTLRQLTQQNSKLQEEIDQLVKLVTPPAPLESKTIPSPLNGYWITYTEYYTDRYWDQHPRQNMTMYSKNLATTIEIDHRQRETIFRTAVQHNGKKLSTIQKSFPHGQWVDYDCDSMISGMGSKLEIIGPNHLRIETVKTQPVDPRYGVEHSRCGGELLHSNIPGILKQTHKGVPNSHGYDHRGISYNRLGQTDSSNYPQNYCSCRPKIVKGTHGVTYGIPDFYQQGGAPGYKITQVTDYKVVHDPINGFHLKMTKLYDPRGAKLRKSDATWWFRKISEEGIAEMNEAHKMPHVQIGPDQFSHGMSPGITITQPSTTWVPEWPVGMP